MTKEIPLFYIPKNSNSTLITLPILTFLGATTNISSTISSLNNLTLPLSKNIKPIYILIFLKNQFICQICFELNKQW